MMPDFAFRLDSSSDPAGHYLKPMGKVADICRKPRSPSIDFAKADQLATFRMLVGSGHTSWLARMQVVYIRPNVHARARRAEFQASEGCLG